MNEMEDSLSCECAECQRRGHHRYSRVRSRRGRHHANPGKEDIMGAYVDVMREAVGLLRDMREDQTKRYANPAVVPSPKPPGLENDVDGPYPHLDPPRYTAGAEQPRTPGECPKDSNVRSQFEHQLAALINKFSLERGTNTPDFILARYLVEALSAYEHAVRATHEWYRDSKWHNPNPTTSYF